MFKEKLMTALEHAVQLYNKEANASEAVIKTAEAFNFNSDQTQRLIELFNTAHAVAHYKSASDKTGTFALASPAKVIERLFDADKMAELMPPVSNPSLTSYDEYSRPEMGTIRTFSIKTASLSALPTPHQPTKDMNLNRHLHTAYGRLDSMKRAEAEIQRTKAICQLEYGRTLDKMANMLRKNYPEVAGEILSTLTKYAVAEHGEEGGYAVAEMAELLPDYSLNVKYAGLADTTDVEPFLQPLELVVTLRTEMNNLDKLATEMHDETEGFAQGLKDALSPFTCEGLPKEAAPLGLPTPAGYQDTIWAESMPGSSSAGSTPPEKEKSLDEKRYDLENEKFQWMKNNPRTTPDKGSTSKPKEPGKSLLMENVINPWIKSVPDTLAKHYDARIQGQQAQAQEKYEGMQRQELLIDLLSNDPVLASEDPNKIGRIYEAVWNIAPNLTRQKEIMRSILRAASQTIATDAYDALSWTQLEKNISQIVGGLVGSPETDKPIQRK